MTCLVFRGVWFDTEKRTVPRSISGAARARAGAPTFEWEQEQTQNPRKCLFSFNRGVELTAETPLPNRRNPPSQPPKLASCCYCFTFLFRDGFGSLDAAAPRRLRSVFPAAAISIVWASVCVAPSL